jgi:PIN domain nuclease of toxin-antitoxin system
MIMRVIGGISSGSSSLQPLIEPTSASVEPQTSTTPAREKRKTVEGVSVTISGVALQKAAQANKTVNSDIEESGLPDNIQQILKMIRLLQQQIAEKMAEMQAVMTDKSLTPEQAQARLANLQTALGGLNAGLMMANASLAKAMKESGLSAEDMMKAVSLVMSHV